MELRPVIPAETGSQRVIPAEAGSHRVIPAEAGIQVEVAYAGPVPLVIALRVALGTTLRGAIEASGLLAQCPEIDLARCGIGVFGKARGPDEPVAAGDRVEVYRPLREDPKERRRRAAARR